jgi:hypothetical protein
MRQRSTEFYEIADTKEMVYIGSNLPDEYANVKIRDILL